MTKEKKKNAFFIPPPPPVILESWVCQKAVTTRHIYIRRIKSMVNWERWREREREREKEELKDAIAPITWIFIVYERFSLLLSRSLLIWKNSFYLCLKRRICLCYYSSTKLNFRSLSRSLNMSKWLQWHACTIFCPIL